MRRSNLTGRGSIPKEVSCWPSAAAGAVNFPLLRCGRLDSVGRATRESTARKLESLIQVLWDIGLDIGHSICTIEECMTEAAADITVKTALLARS